jgi:hypothetical protein
LKALFWLAGFPFGPSPLEVVRLPWAGGRAPHLLTTSLASCAAASTCVAASPVRHRNLGSVADVKRVVLPPSAHTLHCSRLSTATAPSRRRQHPLLGGSVWDQMHSRTATPPPSSLLNPVRLPPPSSVQVLLQASYVKSSPILCSSSSFNFC